MKPLKRLNIYEYVADNKTPSKAFVWFIMYLIIVGAVSTGTMLGLLFKLLIFGGQVSFSIHSLY